MAKKKPTFSIVKKSKIGSSENWYALEVEQGTESFSFDLPNRNYQGILSELREQIDITLGLDQILEAFACTRDDAERILEQHNKDKRCQGCSLKYKSCMDCVFTYTDRTENYLFRESVKRELSLRDLPMKVKHLKNEFENYDGCKPYCKLMHTDCFDCAFVCESPLERKLLIGLRNQGLKPKLQMSILKDGTFLDHPYKPDLSDLLTRPDFVLTSKKKQLCVYADGFTYHERTEKQAIRDRNIDRVLQEMGHHVMRFTTKEIMNTLDVVVQKIQNVHAEDNW